MLGEVWNTHTKKEFKFFCELVCFVCARQNGCTAKSNVI